MYANKFCDAGQVPIFRYFEAWIAHASLCTAIWTPWYPVYTLLSMRGSRIFRQGGGGPGQSDKKSPDNVCFSPKLILLKSNG